jgi:hypothetical protein
MEKTEYKWVKLLGFKAGMRYFRDALTEKVAAADNSGKYPDQTDDGVLWLDLDQAVTIELGSREYSRVTVPVKSERGNGRGYYVGEEINHLGEFLPLWTSLGGKVALRGEVNADVLQHVLEHVTRPLQVKCSACDHFLPPGMVSGCHLVKISGKEIPCYGPEEAATAKGDKPSTPAVGDYSRRYFAELAPELAAKPAAAGASAEGGSQPEMTDGEVHAGKIFSAMRWVCQEARAAVMADDLHRRGLRLREALKMLADAYEGK